MDDKPATMTYEEALEYTAQYGIITEENIYNLDRKFIEAQKIIKEYRYKEFMDYQSRLL